MFKKNIFVIILALVMVLSLAACGPKTEDAVNADNMEKTEEPMETTAAHDDDSMEEDNESDSDDDSLEHEDSDDDSMDDEDTMEDGDTMELKVFTLDELSAFNGLDGMPAYVAVDGVVYDFTNLGAWRNGKHNGFTAGKDLTDEIINVSPHGVKNLEGVPIVGSLAEE